MPGRYRSYKEGLHKRLRDNEEAELLRPARSSLSANSNSSASARRV